MELFKAILFTVGFVALYGFVEWFAGVTAPVLGPLAIVGLLVTLIWLMVRLYKWGK
jgi:hypothetical protein